EVVGVLVEDRTCQPAALHDDSEDLPAVAAAVDLHQRGDALGCAALERREVRGGAAPVSFCCRGRVGDGQVVPVARVELHRDAQALDLRVQRGRHRHIGLFQVRAEVLEGYARLARIDERPGLRDLEGRQAELRGLGEYEVQTTFD